MSILIKGMEMPQNCICCDLSHEDGWCPAKQTFTDRYTFETCPLVHVPPHGDLIDRDELRGAMFIGEQCLYAWDEIEDAIDSAPTIIPASEEGKT